MPLILLSGFPSSGMTTIAERLVTLLQEQIDNTPALQQKHYSIVVHSDESLGITHNDYKTSQDERKLRSRITSAVRRDLSKNKIVIVDSLNYIKGFRYQLHCEVKNIGTSFCLIQTMCPVDTVKEWNANNKLPWDESLLMELIQRYEEPNSQNRWDSPLFPVFTPTDKIDTLFPEISTIVFQLSKNGSGASINNGASNDSSVTGLARPTSATVLKPAQKSNYLQILDNETSQVVKLIVNTIKSNESIGGSSQGVRLLVNGTDIDEPGCYYIDLPLYNLTLPKLQRLKRQFVMLYKLRNLETDRIVPLFTDYLNKQFNE
ncbi:similar to Saccharomyces cerevisiae YKL110C KTI12 Protein that plays a role, with Elongator complex, in modification of wobble nucleosides in tRNA [Maudiozyma barnettii]|uniref:Similar to Saccharomyces cerevisiae YKL110C KTI12 Protein that plays a role, with Elongator complex, in modification of wobble nucleosides in tRNA n=1 Tax=Maudiozyma barnettii TaxID=61262 RepID=A0A8H2VKQ6_9SACH|nr:Kti12p [Kazachstania barnettii]CAB4257143.1 similar to Saccharomyces cerevisiae YKL110C KTI12 Protein that plays a role, with Elongator complex, in modification of wobble nucleosides in tRNA [Kazachstania barnettii]CAD1779513.1 similar to Saccharomyces cerevisiae YKL110C KTI12 Protein that plays a role, with Elongator complex, in modification of wobble nucleosides in tRNA [Kazachstania barnettii]